MAQVNIAGYVPGAIGKITELHATWYHRHWDFGPYFERKVAVELSEFFGGFDEKKDGLWLAAFEGRILGSIAIDGIDVENKGAHLRWFIVDPEYQGQGIGTMLIRKALEFCEKSRYRRVYLWTFAGLDGARHLYETHGFALCKEHEDNQWGVTLREQMFERLLE
ncbi:MAG: GNAT family N-acetyltransferase [Pseudomonadota bacterium]